VSDNVEKRFEPAIRIHTYEVVSMLIQYQAIKLCEGLKYMWRK